MSAAAFALRDGRRVEIDLLCCMRWVQVFSGEELDPLAYETIPRRVLPQGVDVAYFNVNYFSMATPESFYTAVAGTMPELQGVEPPVRNEPFFALNRAGHFVPITNRQAVLWLMELYPSNPATEARFVSIPAPMLPPGVLVAWFDAYTFQSSMQARPRWVPDLAPPARRRRVTAMAKAKARAMPAPSTDTRPLMTPQWCLDNEVEFQRRRDDRPLVCPICLDESHCAGPIDGFRTTHVSTRCTHMMCSLCWGRVYLRDRKCPFCRDDVSEWLSLIIGV
jgi:hypothetical protein